VAQVERERVVSHFHQWEAGHPHGIVSVSDFVEMASAVAPRKEKKALKAMFREALRLSNNGNRVAPDAFAKVSPTGQRECQPAKKNVSTTATGSRPTSSPR
jgi:hypothetical protein